MFRFKFSAALMLFLFALSLLPLPSFAAGSGAFIAVYNSGRAQVRETRVVTLPKGAAAVVFTDVPETLDPTSIRAFAQGMTVNDIAYSYTPITVRNLLDAYVGKELTVILPDPSDANARILRKATLVSNQDGPVFITGKEVYVGDYDAILLPELPKGLNAEPTLTLTTDSADKGTKGVSLSYLMGGLNWRADYTMTVDKDGARAAIDAWATVTNTSGKMFKSADVRLVAGEVSRALGKRMTRNAPVMAMESMDMDAVPAPASEESFSQYHVYAIDRAISLPANGTKQVGLFSAPAVAVSQELTSRFSSGPSVRRGEMKQPVESALIFTNTKQNGLGVPMPEGLVRVFMPTSDGNNLLAGEVAVGHKAEGKEVRLVLGRSFDVNVERVQKNYEKIGKNAFTMTWEITATNGNAKPQDLKLLDSFPGDWEVIKADVPYSKVDGSTIAFNISGLTSVPKVITYTVRITY
ncbi:DUF4139 domain-containing protein [Pseudodesulfovibrio sediminis]|uniref:DUF4139 domain-containing protein n=1 Tax=Pseudodesulfovibrio sediminis TaxID=2810563 RepID=A0ABM7P3S0_9BACT|nr:DUF4139 domain-containing protein [Pseudodesulfovibrio sediminis]BCS88285.1 DUF4139 domain-containing protein [Pseudodesulfovibrio sediminis]